MERLLLPVVARSAQTLSQTAPDHPAVWQFCPSLLLPARRSVRPGGMILSFSISFPVIKYFLLLQL